VQLVRWMAKLDFIEETVAYAERFGVAFSVETARQHAAEDAAQRQDCFVQYRGETVLVDTVDALAEMRERLSGADVVGFDAEWPPWPVEQHHMRDEENPRVSLVQLAARLPAAHAAGAGASTASAAAGSATDAVGAGGASGAEAPTAATPAAAAPAVSSAGEASAAGRAAPAGAAAGAAAGANAAGGDAQAGVTTARGVSSPRRPWLDHRDMVAFIVDLDTLEARVPPPNSLVANLCSQLHWSVLSLSRLVSCACHAAVQAAHLRTAAS
jgi:hypothetical protein